MRSSRFRLIGRFPQAFFGLSSVALLRCPAYSFLPLSAFFRPSPLLGSLAPQAFSFNLSAAFLRCPAVSFLSLSVLLRLTLPSFRFLFLLFDVPVVISPRILVAENLIRLVNFLEPLFGVRGITAVWVELQRQPAIRPADVIAGSVSAQSKDFVVVGCHWDSG